MRINTNIMAMNTKRQLGINNSNASKTVEKLSSGLRINRAADDAAGLAISEKMRSQIRGLNQASRNAQDAISLVQTAEGALGTTHDILQKMRELAVQAANDTNVTVDRGQIQKEINQLTSEINRIGNTTEFNTMKLIDGSRAIESTTTVTPGNVITSGSGGSVAVNYSAGVTPTFANSTTKFISGSVTVAADTAEDEKIDWSALTDQVNNTINIAKDSGNLKVTITADDGANAVVAELVIDAETIAAASGDTYTVDFRGVSFSVNKADFAASVDGDNYAINLNTVKGEDGTGGATFSAIGDINMENNYKTNYADMTANVTVSGSNNNLIGVKSVGVALNAAGDTLTVSYYSDVDGTSVLFSDTMTLTTALGDGDSFTYDEYGVSFTFKAVDHGSGDVSFETNAIDISSYTAKLTPTETKTVTPGTDNSLAFQVGANQNQAIQVAIKDMRSEALGISSTTGGGAISVVNSEGETKAVADAAYTATKTVTKGTDNESIEYALDVTNHKKAAGAVTVFDNAIELVSDQRSALGAVQNRLEYTIKNLDIASENLSASESRIRDADMAAEIMSFTKNNILNQAATAMLAQANQAPQSVLQLLQ